MARGAEKIDLMFVDQQRAMNRPWSAISKMLKVSEDLLRRTCDGTYTSPDLGEAARRAPKLASGREGRPNAYTVNPDRVSDAPPASNTVSPTVQPARPAPLAVPAPPPERRMSPKPKEETAVQQPRIAALPTARAVAVAIVAAARVLGDDPLTLGQGGGLLKRFRYPAFAALRARYPGASLAALGRLTDLPAGAPGTCLHAAQGSKWWAAYGDAAMDAALTALDAEGA